MTHFPTSITTEPPVVASNPSELELADSTPLKASPAPMVVMFVDHTAAESGGEIALLRLIEALDLKLVCPIVLFAADGPMIARLQSIGVSVHLIPLSDSVRNLRKDTLGLGGLRRVGAMVSILVYAIRVARFAKRHGVQLIHTNSLKSDIYGGIAGWLARLPVIWHVRDHINPSYLPPVAVAIFRFLVSRMPAFVVANSQSTLKELHLDRERPSAVVPSGLLLRSRVVHDGLTDDELRDDRISTQNPLTAQRDRSDRRPRSRFGIVGRIARWKGQHVFLEAARQVIAAGGDAEFWIIGGPLFGEESYEAELRQQAVESGLGGRVHFLGFQQNVPDLLRQLDIVVHASISPEPFGQVVIEAMAEGLPVIGTDGGGVREIIEHGKNGLLVPMDNAEAMADAMRLILADPASGARLGAAAYHRVRQHFTSAQSARKMERIYHAIVHPDNRKAVLNHD